MSFDVLEKTHSWLKKSNSVCDPRPEVARVFFSCSFSCGRERLAWVSRNEDVHQSVKRFVREGFKIVPKRCDIHESRFHFTDEIGLSEPLKFTICEGSHSFAKDVFESKSNASIAGAHFNSCDGSIHIIFFFLFSISSPYRQSGCKKQLFFCGAESHITNCPTKKITPPLIGGFFVGNFLWISWGKKNIIFCNSF